MIGTIVLAKPNKPGKPGKSPPDLEIADFKIWIGKEGPQDIIVNSPSFLDVQDEVGGYWLPPPTKGKTQREDWGVGLLEEQGHDCGTYIIADVEGDSGYGELGQTLAEHGINSTVEARFFYIGHRNTQNARPPESEAPPITTAAITSSSAPIPAVGCAEIVRLVAIMAASPTSAPEKA